MRSRSLWPPLLSLLFCLALALAPNNLYADPNSPTPIPDLDAQDADQTAKLAEGITTLDDSNGNISALEAKRQIDDMIKKFLASGGRVFDPGSSDYTPGHRTVLGMFAFTDTDATFSDIKIKHLIKMRAKELCPHNKENWFLVEYHVVVNNKGRIREQQICRWLHFNNPDDIKSNVAYAKQRRMKPIKDQWRCVKSTLISDDYNTNVTRINKLREKITASSN